MLDRPLLVGEEDDHVLAGERLARGAAHDPACLRARAAEHRRRRGQRGRLEKLLPRQAPPGVPLAHRRET
jgi:hypothetical protein